MKTGWRPPKPFDAVTIFLLGSLMFSKLHLFGLCWLMARHLNLKADRKTEIS
jgi:hypothetical protein